MLQNKLHQRHYAALVDQLVDGLMISRATLKNIKQNLFLPLIL